jgi:hypothetical protein
MSVSIPKKEARSFYPAKKRLINRKIISQKDKLHPQTILSRRAN